MIFNVPQFIDIEDKIVGPLTAKQLGWLAAGAVIVLVLYSLFDKSTFIISAIIVAVIFGALAFYKPYNQPLIKFILSSVVFTFRPKMYIWHRMPEKIQKDTPKREIAPTIDRKKFDAKKVANLSSLLDTKNRQNH
jgi:hypothetical protein